MTIEIPAPYDIEVLPLERPAGHYCWALRKNGKLIERSDRPHLTEQKAWTSALKALESNQQPGARW
ncbi:hypothetical protein [Methylobacterium sp. A54F]